MARLILDSGESTGLSAGTFTIFGTKTGKETVTVGAGAKVTFDASFNAGGDIINLGGNASTWTAVRSGSSIVLTSTAGGSVTIPVGTSGASVVFADAPARSLSFNTALGQIELGTQAVGFTAATVAAGTGGSGSTSGQTFTLTAGVDNKTLGDGNDTFEATASTFTAGDVLNGGAGTDTLNISDNVAAMGVRAPSVTLTSVEKVAISTTGGLGVAAVAGVTAVAQVNTYTFNGNQAPTDTLVVNYGTQSSTVLLGADAAASLAGAINNAAGRVVAVNTAANVVTVTAPTAGTPLPAITFGAATDADSVPATAFTTANVAGVAGVAAAAYDLSGFSSVGDISVAASGAVNLSAATTQAVSITNTSGGVTLSGGSTQSVTTAGGYAISGGTGAVTVVDSAQGAVNSTVDGGTNVTITSTAKNAGGTTGSITVGAATGGAPTGAVVVNSTIAEGRGTTSTAAGAIAVTGGSSVTINQVATKSVQTSAAANGTITNAAVTVTGTSATTSVTAKASAAVSAVSTTLAVAGVTEVNTLTFAGIAAGETIILNGLTFTNTSGGALTAAQVAAAFANLTAGATQGNSTKGTYSGAFNVEGWTSGAVTGTSTVVFTATSTGTRTNLADTGTGADPTVVVTTDGVAAVAAAGRTGVTANSVTITDVNNVSATKVGTITTATAENYTTFTFNGNALSTLNLTGGSGNITIANGGLTSSSNKTLNLTVNNLSGGTLDDADVYTTLNVTATGKSSTLADITSTALTALNVAGDKTLTLTSTTGASALVDVKVTGSAGLSATFAATTMKTIDTSGTTGTSTITFDATKATYTGGAGIDRVTTSAIAPTKAISLGDGNDKLTLASGTVSVTGAISGGAGTDTLSMVVVDAATADNDVAFSAQLSGFEILELTGSAGAQSINLTNLGLTNNVIVGAGAGAGTTTIDGFASGGTLTINGGRGGSGVTVTNAAFATPTNDTFNLVVTNIGGAGNINAGTVTIANVETVNISVNDGDQVIPADTHTLTLTADKATSVVITNDNTIDTPSTSPTSATDNTNLNLTLTGSTKVTLVDGSAMTGGLTVTSVNTTTGATLRGGSGADSLTAATGSTADTLIGGAGNDTLTSNAGLTTLTGGAGSDLFVVATAGANSNVYTTITDATSGDRIQLAQEGLETFVATKLSLAATASFADYVNFATDGNGSTNGIISWFQFNGNTYIVQDNSVSADFDNGTDIVVALTGLVDLSLASLNTTTPAAPVLLIA